jgi:uncharacterized caspase-like protein
VGALFKYAVLVAFALGINLASSGAALAERRVALIIGNAKYENAGVLTNTVHDAAAITDLLTKAGFDVVDHRVDLGVVDFKRAVREFVDRAATADVAVVYYSGHGLEFGGVNYLVPVDAKLTSAIDIDDEAVSLDRILLAAGHAKKLSLIILDACRENPFHPVADDARVTRGVSMGLGRVDQSVSDTLIAFAAKAGSFSYDGDGANSPFTTALVKYIALPGLDIRLALGKVRDEVLRATNNRQEPYVYGSLGGENISLVPDPKEAPVAVAPAAPADLEDALAFRQALRTGSLDGWRAFLTVHPNGNYAELARTETEKFLAAEKLEAARSETAALTPEAICKRDEDRLERLRVDPSSEEASRFVRELSCEKLRPQLARLMESLGFAAPSTEPASPPSVEAAIPAVRTVSDCASDQAALERLRMQPTRETALALWRDLQCARLRPQVRLLMESMNLPIDNPTAEVSQSGTSASATQPSNGDSVRGVPVSKHEPADPAACRREGEELDQLRANPDRGNAERFARGLTCDALRSQAARLLESLNE